jgi:uncharacterized protein (TIGR02118 family)
MNVELRAETREHTMVRVSVFYPNKAGVTFDMDYYVTKHMPMVKQKLGAACKSMTIDAGLGGGGPGAPAAFVAMCHLGFDSAEAFQAALAPHAQEIMGDIPNYTNAQPVIQISEVKM